MNNFKLIDIVEKFRGDGQDLEMWLDRLEVAVKITSKAGATDAELEETMLTMS